jgi:RHS repeat-associated protein
MTHSIADNHYNSHQQRTVLLATDHKNSVLAEIAGAEPNPIAYSAYGQQSGQQEVATRLGFNGELREAHIGWYLLGNGYRAYNPLLMRFHSPDSWSPFGRGGLNAYMYCGGEPVMNKDPTGHLFIPQAIQTLINNLGDVPRIFQAQRAAGQNAVSAMISSVSGTGNVSKGLHNTLGAPSPNGLSMVPATPQNNRFTAKEGWFNQKVGGVPSSTPDRGSNASNPGSSGGSMWERMDRAAAENRVPATPIWVSAGNDRIKLVTTKPSVSSSSSSSTTPPLPPRTLPSGAVRGSDGVERMSLSQISSATRKK